MTKTTIETITSTQIESLRAEAVTAGDRDMVVECDVALTCCGWDGSVEDHPAVRTCVAAIRDAEAQQ